MTESSEDIRVDVDNMTINELKDELGRRGLVPVRGRKAVLQQQLRDAIAAEASESTTIEHTEDHSNNAQGGDFHDFDTFLDDATAQIADGNDHPVDAGSVDIDALIGQSSEVTSVAAVTEQGQIGQEESKAQTISDFDLEPTDTPNGNTNGQVGHSNGNTISNGNTESTITTTIPTDFALDAESKKQKRIERFGAMAMDEQTKMESRKRRFGTIGVATGSTKRTKLDEEAQRKKVFERAQKFGTALPKNFKLSEEETKQLHAAKIERAERFGTQHLLPSAIKEAADAVKKAERMKRFGGIPVTEDKDKIAERQQRFGTGADNPFGDKTLDEITAEKKKENRKKRNMQSNRVQQRQQGGFKKGRGRGYRGRGRGRRGGGGRGKAKNQSYRLVNGDFSAEDKQKMKERKARFQ